MAMNGISRYNLRSIDAPTSITGKKRSEIDSLQINIFQGGSSSKKLKKEEQWGSKHANLLLMEEGLNLPGVIVPRPWGISSQAVAALLNKHGGIHTAWSALNRLFLQNSLKPGKGRAGLGSSLGSSEKRPAIKKMG